MKHFLIAAAVVAVTASTPTLAADVTVSVSVGQPDFYGRLDIGGFPPPQVIYRQPVVVERVVVERQPVYLRVPPGHAKHWSKHCHAYQACGERVYFVRDDWYNREYAPRYRERYRDHREDRRDDDRHEGHGHGHGHGRDRDR